MTSINNMGNRKTKSIEHINGITKCVPKLTLNDWPANITTIDISHAKLDTLKENVKFPPNLLHLNMSHNKFQSIPKAVLDLSCLKSLDASFNIITFFDDTPQFCQTIENLNLSNNILKGPPYWVWAASPCNLVQLDLSCNIQITHALRENNVYYEELKAYISVATDINIQGCMLGQYAQILQTFPKVKTLTLGKPDSSYGFGNHLVQVPFEGLEKCCDIERLNLSCTNIYTIESKIDIFKCLTKINLSHNNLISIPNAFCTLENLEICLLSYNKIMYLPDDIAKLRNLVHLDLASNEICMLPEDLGHLLTLDLYDNCLYEISDKLRNVLAIDLALNFFDEPEDIQYLESKKRIRVNIDNRVDGRKKEPSIRESVHSPSTSEDEEIAEYWHIQPENDEPLPGESSTEDWDSDEYWEPNPNFRQKCPSQSLWISYVTQKMREGNFCPMDLHPVSIAEKVKYEKLCNPKVWTEIEGQFDDYDE